VRDRPDSLVSDDHLDRAPAEGHDDLDLPVTPAVGVLDRVADRLGQGELDLTRDGRGEPQVRPHVLSCLPDAQGNGWKTETERR
jgi:hypothetical protein